MGYRLLNRCWHASQVYLDTYATRQHSFENERISKRIAVEAGPISGMHFQIVRESEAAFCFVNRRRENAPDGLPPDPDDGERESERESESSYSHSVAKCTTV